MQKTYEREYRGRCGTSSLTIQLEVGRREAVLVINLLRTGNETSSWVQRYCLRLTDVGIS